VHVGRVTSGVLDDLDLRVIDAREVARASGLVLLGLERERVRVDTGHGVAGVVVVGLDLVEVLTLLFLETILAVRMSLKVLRGPAASSVNGLEPPSAPSARRGVPTEDKDTKQLESVGSGLDWRTTEELVETLEKFHRVFLLAATLEKHQTSSLTGWLYERRTCLVPAEVTVSVPVCWTCSIRYS